MTASSLLSRSLATALGTAALFLVIGCADDGLGKRYSVSGTVSYKGTPVEKGVINFIPTTADGHGATGQIEKGSYSLTTLTPGDGALPGKYKVTVDAREVDMEKAKAQAEKDFAKKGVTKLSMIPQEYQAKALKEAKNPIPGKYQIEQTTTLEAEVKPQSNTIPFDLTD